MKVAQRILKNKNEALAASTKSALNTWATKAHKDASSISDKTAKSIASALSDIALSIEEKDEKGALDDIKKFSALIKKLDIEG